MRFSSIESARGRRVLARRGAADEACLCAALPAGTAAPRSVGAFPNEAFCPKNDSDAVKDRPRPA